MQIQTLDFRSILQRLIDEVPAADDAGQPGLARSNYNEWVTRVELLMTEFSPIKRDRLEERLKAIRVTADGEVPFLQIETLNLVKGMLKAIDDGTLP